jgi:hypothetical protein
MKLKENSSVNANYRESSFYLLQNGTSTTFGGGDVRLSRREI